MPRIENRGSVTLKHPVTDIIRFRSSIRGFSDKPIPESELRQLREACCAQKGPHGSECRFRIIDSYAEKDELRRVGAYGVIRNARLYIAGAVMKTENCMEDFGYLFEKIILHATDLGLATCWLGGTFNRSSFAERMRLAGNEVMPAVSPVGYSTEKRRSLDRFIRWYAGSKRRKPWQDLFFSESFSLPMKENEGGDFIPCLEMIRLAPSASNRQPWRILKKNNNFHFYLRRTPGYRMLLKLDLQRLDIGIAMCHFELTAESLNKKGNWIIKKAAPEVKSDIEYIVTWEENV